MELKKLKARGLYRAHKETLNGRIVYEQLLPEDSFYKPHYIQWVRSATGKFEWIIGQGWNDWKGECLAKCKHIVTGYYYY